MTCIMFSALLLLLATPSLGFYSFRTKIPNGEIVPHPCKPNYLWSGVGHMNPDGGGDRNPFGRDFDEAGYRWSEELCRHDSDGDGKTNGEELGDPNCTWMEGTVPERVTDITHPGICDPYGKGQCAGKDEYVDCEVESFEDSCEVIKNPEVMSVDYRFKEFEVPNTETNYYCQYFDLPVADSYHVVADEGIIDQADFVHHMLLYGCPDDYKSSPTDDSPNPCSMSGEGRSCNTLISIWSVGYPGNCNGDDMGFKVGLNGYKKVKLEIHYNNPMLKSGYRDTSGMRIYYRSALPGIKELATLAIGQTILQIPPGESNVQFEGSCPGDCTQTIVTKPMYVVSAINHMHYLGRSQKTEVIRDGVTVKVLADDPRYDYDSPIMHKLEEPFEVLPGDELLTTCTFSSMSKKRWVFYGDATNDEMCFAFIILYPFDAIPYTKWCTSHGPLSTCDMFRRSPRNGCDWSRFSNLSNPEMTEHYLSLEHNCNMDGVCRPECKEVVEEIKQHPCMAEEMSTVIHRFLNRYHEGTKFLAWLHSCDGHDGHGPVDCKDECDHMCKDDGDDDWEPNAGSTVLPAMSQMAAILMMSFIYVVLTNMF